MVKVKFMKKELLYEGFQYGEGDIAVVRLLIPTLRQMRKIFRLDRL